MFYAASEIVFWILLAAIAGGGIGYGLSQAKSVRLNQRLAQSKADAPMERELAAAWDSIEDLNKRLQVAHETIRGSAAAGPVNLFVEPQPAPPTAVARPPRDASNGDKGTRLSERVASASAGATAKPPAPAEPQGTIEITPKPKVAPKPAANAAPKAPTKAATKTSAKTVPKPIAKAKPKADATEPAKTK